MICPRHGAIASKHDDQGWPLCEGCFREAITKADDILLEEKLANIYALRLNSVDALMQRLGWKR